MPSELPSVSIVVPAFNEAGRIYQSLRAIGEYVGRIPSTDFELIVVDDGSTDGTASVAERHLPAATNVRSRVLRYGANRGKAYAVRFGLLAAGAPIALFTDADLSTPIDEMPKILGPRRGAAGAYDAGIHLAEAAAHRGRAHGTPTVARTVTA